MGTGAAPRQATLLVHDGELADVRALLAELGLPFAERRGALAQGDLEQRWGLAMATPRRIALLKFADPAPACIAICDRDSRTLRTSLKRSGIELVVRRPVHRAALRGLILHALYRGPERRRDARVAIGAPVAYRGVLRRHRAILADLSLGGCHLVCERAVGEGRGIHLLVPSELTGGGAFGVRARVLRARQDHGGSHHISARFEKLGERKRALLRAVVERFAEGPAVLDAESASAPVAASPVAEAAEPQAPAAIAAAPASARRDVSLDEQAARVLLGREISISGMRVDRDALLRVGQDVRLALHVASLDAPLVVTARVHRDEGKRGMVLRFHALSPADTRHLHALLESLPAFDPNAKDDAGVVVSEILEPARAIA
jgi:c-di-GMP-binding flagellar brake protein YcgR